jgi:NADPH2 dehydrogenase
MHRYGSKIGIQIAHAGRKAQDDPLPVAPSRISVSHDDTTPVPYALTTAEVEEMVLRYKEAATRAVASGFDCIELHGAHGYLIHQFHSPAINNRDDQYGKDLALFGEQVIEAVRSVMPADMPLLFRISAMEYMQDGYGVDHAIEISKRYLAAGVDCFHVSSGGEGPVSVVQPGSHSGYQVPLAKAYKEAFPGVPIIAVGKLEEAEVAEAVLAEGHADLVAIGRGLLNDPYWALHTIKQLTGTITPPAPYVRGM